MGLGYSEHLEEFEFESGLCIPVYWFAGSKGDRHNLVVCRVVRMVSPVVNEASPVQDETA
jgi:hypothetical protein